jgi:radical SAM-linked protein
VAPLHLGEVFVLTARLRLRFSRQGPAVWLAHLDMMRTFERAVRRAGIPVAYSSGFNPRPQLSFALPIGVGIATEDDWLDVLLSEDQPAGASAAETWMGALNEKLPEGLAVHAAEQLPAGGSSLMSLVCAAEYMLECPGLAAAVERLFLPEEGGTVSPWLVEKVSKGKKRQLDIRPLILSVQSLSADRVLLMASAGSRDHLRPDLFLQLLTDRAGLETLAAADCSVTRTATRLREG